MLKDKYMMYKQTYKDFIILIQSGTFFVTFADDALIINNIFQYKIKIFDRTVKIGFPVTILNKITTELQKREINYIVINNNDDIIDKQNTKKNKYKNYVNGGYEVSINRINKLNEILKNNLSNQNINKILTQLEEVVCTINS